MPRHELRSDPGTTRVEPRRQTKLAPRHASPPRVDALTTELLFRLSVRQHLLTQSDTDRIEVGTDWIGDKSPELRIQRPIPVTIYLSDQAAHAEVQQAVADLLIAFEFD